MINNINRPPHHFKEEKPPENQAGVSVSALILHHASLYIFFLQEMLPCIYRAEKNNVKLPVGLRSDRNPDLLLSKSWPVKTHLLLCFSNLLVLLNLSS